LQCAAVALGLEEHDQLGLVIVCRVIVGRRGGVAHHTEVAQTFQEGSDVRGSDRSAPGQAQVEPPGSTPDLRLVVTIVRRCGHVCGTGRRRRLVDVRAAPESCGDRIGELVLGRVAGLERIDHPLHARDRFEQKSDVGRLRPETIGTESCQKLLSGVGDVGEMLISHRRRHSFDRVRMTEELAHRLCGRSGGLEPGH
jgi:hypothetical protein